MKSVLVSMFLYGVLGGLLGYAGVSFSENPLTFLSIVAIVVVIDLNAFNLGLSKGEQNA